MISVTVMWRNSEGATFDHDYYLSMHVPMLRERLGQRLKSVAVDRGVGGLEPGVAPPYVALTRLQFDSIEEFQAAFAPHLGAIRGDERNFTNIPVQVQISESVV